jgi:hypothetical protein
LPTRFTSWTGHGCPERLGSPWSTISRVAEDRSAEGVHDLDETGTPDARAVALVRLGELGWRIDKITENLVLQ